MKKKILKELKGCETFYEFLLYIKNTEGLKMEIDNNWFWLEYNGEEIENTAKERFTNQSEMYDLMTLAGIN